MDCIFTRRARSPMNAERSEFHRMSRLVHLSFYNKASITGQPWGYDNSVRTRCFKGLTSCLDTINDSQHFFQIKELERNGMDWNEKEQIGLSRKILQLVIIKSADY